MEKAKPTAKVRVASKSSYPVRKQGNPIKVMGAVIGHYKELQSFEELSLFVEAVTLNDVGMQFFRLKNPKLNGLLMDPYEGNFELYISDEAWDTGKPDKVFKIGETDLSAIVDVLA